MLIRNIGRETFLMILIKQPFYIFGFCLSCTASGYFYFHNNKILKEGSQCIWLSVILIDSVYRKYKNYYPQVL